jgi:hypothetical protein
MMSSVLFLAIVVVLLLLTQLPTVHSQVDGKPLKMEQHIALQAVFQSLACSNQSHCPAFKSTDPCPNIGIGAYARRLSCRNGDVLELFVDAPSSVDANAVLASEIGLLTGLETLYLFNLGISGTIPTQVGRLTAMVNMNLCCQRLSGTVPTQLSRLTRIVELDVVENRLSSTIPSELGLISTLSFPRFARNFFVGTAPAFAAFVNQTAQGDCGLARNDAETNCFDRCLQPICCNSTRFCPYVTTSTSITTSITTMSTAATSTSMFTRPNVDTATSAGANISGTNASTTTTTNDSVSTTTTTSDVDLILARSDDEWRAVAIGVGVAVLVVLLLTIVIVCVVRNKRKKQARPELQFTPPPAVHTIPQSEYISIGSLSNAERPGTNQYAVMSKTVVTYDSGNIEL